MAVKPSEIQATFTALERRLVELHRAFEQYFLGIERRPPVEERDQLKKDLQRARAGMGRASTANRFRANGVWQRFVSHEQMWNRTLKQIEDGTYHRDVAKAKRRAKAEAATADRPAQKPAERKSEKKPETSTLAEPMIKKIYDTYVMARKRTGESTQVSMGSLARQLRERARSMQHKHGAGVEFKVVIKGGKALIRAQPKKPK